MVKITDREMADRLETVDVKERSDPGTSATSPIIEREERIIHDAAAERGLFLTQVSQLTRMLLGIADDLIRLQVLLKFMAANPDNTFAKFVYDFTAPFLGPFTNLISNPTSNGWVLETSLVDRNVGIRVGRLGAVQTPLCVMRPARRAANLYFRCVSE